MTHPQPASHSAVKSWKLSSRVKNRQGGPLSPLLLSVALGVRATVITGKRHKSHQIGKGQVKLSLFADEMILCTENPINSTKTTVRGNKLIQ